MDQGRKVRSQVDATVVSSLHCQSSTAAAVRLGLQSGEFPEAAGSAEACPALVADNTAREAGQDWGKGRASLPLRDVSDGRGGDPSSVVSGDPATD